MLNRNAPRIGLTVVLLSIALAACGDPAGTTSSSSQNAIIPVESATATPEPTATETATPAPTSTPGVPVLGAASEFAILGATTVTCTNTSSVDGDVGVSPGTAITGFNPG